MQKHNYAKLRKFTGSMIYARGAYPEKPRKALSPCDRQILERLLNPVRIGAENIAFRLHSSF